MPSENYKKWTIGAIILFAIVIFIFTGTRYRVNKPADNVSPQTSSTGPVIDPGTDQDFPLDQALKGTETPESLTAIGDWYFESKRFQEAIDVYEKVLELTPNDVDTYNDLGLAFHYTGKSDLAVNTLRKGTSVNPSFQRIWLSLGFVLASTGNNNEAKEALKKAVELDPDSEPGLEAKKILGLLK